MALSLQTPERRKCWFCAGGEGLVQFVAFLQSRGQRDSQTALLLEAVELRRQGHSGAASGLQSALVQS